MHSLVQALTLTVWLHFLIHCSNNRVFKLIVGALRTDLSEFQGQNFKVGGTLTLGAELVCFYIQEFCCPISRCNFEAVVHGHCLRCYSC